MTATSGSASRLAFVGQHERHRDDAGKAQLAPLAHLALGFPRQDRAIAVEAADRNLVDDRGRAGSEPHHVAVPCPDDLAHAEPLGELGMRLQMARLAVHGDGDLAASPSDTAARARRAAGGRRHGPSASWSVMSSQPMIGEAVLHAADGLLVAGNGARGEDHAVARIELDVRVFALRRCAPSPRAARPGCRCRAPRRCRGGKLGEMLAARETAGLGRDSRSPARRSMTRYMARPTTTSSRPAARAAFATERMRATLEAKVVTATRWRRLADEAGRASPRRRPPTASTPSRMALVESQTSASTPSSPSALSRASSVGALVNGRRVELPVAGVEDGAKRGADDRRRGLGDRMRHGDQLDIERADGDAAADRHDLERKTVEHAAASESFDLSIRR